MSDNPLASPQREKSGAETFGKYEFQYHWGLYRVLDEHKNNKEYALIMELHEDVVIANSLDAKTASFEFNQVKNIGSPKYNAARLTKVKNGRASVLAKLIKSASSKPFTKKIDTINLVASCGFSLDLKNNGLDLEVIRVGDLSNECIEELRKALKAETGDGTIPANLRFVIPKLHIHGQQDLVIARIAELVDHLFPGSHCNSISIYRSLIDELHRKGSVSFDYMQWSELLNNKALTSEKVAKAIQVHTSARTSGEIMSDYDALATELGLKFFDRKQLRKRIERYYFEWIGFPSALVITAKAAITSALDAAKQNQITDAKAIIDMVFGALSDQTKTSLGDDMDIRAAIMFVMITGDV